MDSLEEILEQFEFEGRIVGGKIDAKFIEEHYSENLTGEQTEILEKELLELSKMILDRFSDVGPDLMYDIELQAKLRIMIQRRMKTMKMIPREYFDKYNEIVTEIRDLIKAQGSYDQAREDGIIP